MEPLQERKEALKVVRFKRARPRPALFIVQVQGVSEPVCYTFDDADDAMDFMEEQEADLKVSCSLYQNVPVEDQL